MDAADKTLWQLSSVVEYLLDRGEIEDITHVLSPEVRYDRKRPTKYVEYACDGKVVRVTAAIVGDAPPSDDDDDA